MIKFCQRILKSQKDLFFAYIVKEMNKSLGQDWGGSYWGSSSKNYREIKKKPSVIPVFKNHKYNTLSFKHVSLDEIAKEVKVLSVKKVCQDTDIFTNIIKRNLN